MATNEIVEIVTPSGTVEVITPEPQTIIELDTGGQTGPRGPAGPEGPTGPQGPQGAMGNQGDQGVQGRFDISIFQRATTAPTAAPTGGSYDIDNGTLTPPTGWFSSPSDATGDGDLYQARTTIDPAMQTGTVTPVWTTPFEAGGTGPAGPTGPVGPQGPAGPQGEMGTAGTDGNTYIPIFFDRTGAGGNVANASLALAETATFVTYVRNDDTRVFQSDGSLVSDIDAQLETLINNLVIGQHSIGRGEQGPVGPQGPIGPQGPAGSDIGGRAYSSTATYSIGDVVSDSNILYISITDNNTGNAITDTTNWRVYSSGSTIEINSIEVDDPNFIDTSGSRGVTYQRVGNQIGARANSDDDKQDNLTADQLAVVNANPFTTADESKLDGIPDFTAHSNLPRLTADLVADREYTIWVTNNTGTNTGAIDRTAVDIQGQDANTLVGTTVSITAGRTIPLYVSWNETSVGDIQNNATNVEPTITFTTPAATVHVATGEDVTTGGGEITVQEEGVSLATAATTLNFEGAGVTAAGDTGTKTITVPDYTLAREVDDGVTDQATIRLNGGTNGSVIIRGQNEITVGESTDPNTILIDYQVIPPIHPENLSISVSPTHVIEDTPNVSATVTLRETGTNWRITGVTQPTASRPGVSFGATTGIGTQSVSIPVTITSEGTATIGNISLSFRVSGNNGLQPTDPDYQAYRSVVRNVNIEVSPVWYVDVLTETPDALNDFSGNRGEFRVGAQETLTGVAGGSIYVAIPTDAVDERVRFTTSNPNIFYQFTTENAIGDFSVFNLGTAVAGTYIVRIGGV